MTGKIFNKARAPPVYKPLNCLQLVKLGAPRQYLAAVPGWLPLQRLPSGRAQ